MDPRAGHDENRLYDYLLDTGVLDDVKSVAESVVGSASVSSTSAADDADADADDEARRIADRLLERNADDVDRALDAIVRDLRLAEPGQLVDYRWPGLVDLRAGQPPRKTLRNLNALLRLPFTYDTYTGAYFRRLTEGLERTFAADAFFRATVLVYAKLVDAAPDLEGAVESFGSLCVAARHRCLRSRDYGKSVTSVCLLTRCLRAVCKRGAGSKNVKPAVVEFVATVSGDAGEHHGPYAILCCADPTARWFDRVSKCYSSRSAFFECLHGDGRLLKAVVSSFFHWITAPKIPKSDRRSDVAVDYACSLHAIHLLAKVFEYRSGRAMFPVRVSRTVRIHAVSVSDYCLGFLSANRDRVPTTLASGLCKLVAVVAAFHGHEVIDSVAASEFGARILADVAERPDASRVAVGREHMADELFRANSRRRMDGAHADSLVRVATALSRRHEHVWRLVTRRMWFLEAAAAVCDVRSLMANVRCTPLGALTYHLDDGWRTDDVDWSDPRQKLLFGVACASGDRGRDWLNRHDAFASSNRFVEARLDEAETCLDPDDRKRLDAVVDVAYSYTCASVAGLTILLDDRGTTLAELYRLTYRRFDDNRFRVHRDVLVMLWLRLMEAATHTFSLRVYADSKLNYQDTLSALAAENRTDDGTVYVAETTRLLTKLRRGGGAVASPPPPAAVRENDAAVSLAVQVSSDAATRGAWTHGVRAAVVRAARISVRNGNDRRDHIVRPPSFRRSPGGPDGRRRDPDRLRSRRHTDGVEVLVGRRGTARVRTLGVRTRTGLRQRRRGPRRVAVVRLHGVHVVRGVPGIGGRVRRGVRGSAEARREDAARSAVRGRRGRARRLRPSGRRAVATGVAGSAQRVQDVRRLVVAPVLRLGVRLFLGPSRLARDMPLVVSGGRVPRGLPGVLLRLSGRRAETSLAGGVQRGPVSRSRLPGRFRRLPAGRPRRLSGRAGEKAPADRVENARLRIRHGLSKGENDRATTAVIRRSLHALHSNSKPCLVGASFDRFFHFRGKITVISFS